MCVWVCVFVRVCVCVFVRVCVSRADLIVLEVDQEVVPQRLPAQDLQGAARGCTGHERVEMHRGSSPIGQYRHLCVTQHNGAEFCPRQRHVEAARVAEEADSLELVGAHARQDDEVLLATLRCGGGGRIVTQGRGGICTGFERRTNEGNESAGGAWNESTEATSTSS